MIADIEIINKVESFLNENNTVLDMNSLNSIYNLCCNHMIVINKRSIKQLLEENIPEIMLVCPAPRHESQRICLPRGQRKAVEKCFQICYDSYKWIFETAKVLRKELIKDEKWRFSDDGFTTPRSLHLLQQLIIAGPRKEPETSFQKNEFGRPVAILAEFIMNMVKTDKQNITVPKKLSTSLA